MIASAVTSSALMVDPERLLSVLGRVTVRLRILDGYAEQDPDGLLGDRVGLGDLKYTFQTPIEACIDAAQHVVADQGLGVPASNADAFRLLARAACSTPTWGHRWPARPASATSWSTTTSRSTTPRWSPTCSDWTICARSSAS